MWQLEDRKLFAHWLEYERRFSQLVCSGLRHCGENRQEVGSQLRLRTNAQVMVEVVRELPGQWWITGPQQKEYVDLQNE